MSDGRYLRTPAGVKTHETRNQGLPKAVRREFPGGSKRLFKEI